LDGIKKARQSTLTLDNSFSSQSQSFSKDQMKEIFFIFVLICCRVSLLQMLVEQLSLNLEGVPHDPQRTACFKIVRLCFI